MSTLQGGCLWLPVASVGLLPGACVSPARRTGRESDRVAVARFRWHRLDGVGHDSAGHRSEAHAHHCEAGVDDEAVAFARAAEAGHAVGRAGQQPRPAARGKSPPDVFPRMKTSGFHGCFAPGIASLRSSRLFIHSLPAARGKSPPDVFPRAVKKGRNWDGARSWDTPPRKTPSARPAHAARRGRPLRHFRKLRSGGVC